LSYLWELQERFQGGDPDARCASVPGKHVFIHTPHAIPAFARARARSSSESKGLSKQGSLCSHTGIIREELNIASPVA
jgi:hypothetical protein